VIIMTTVIALRCPLCTAPGAQHYHRDSRRHYLQCPRCQLVFVDPAERLSAAAEKAEYDLHQNVIDDSGYQQFLTRLAKPMLARLTVGMQGLDFGCGDGPALAQLFTEAGLVMSCYDLFYRHDPALLQCEYHFITATEVVEHLFEPGLVLSQLWAQLYGGGHLGLMTKLVIDREAFATWHYKNDQTHVCFFSVETFVWLATSLGAELEILGSDVIILSKPDIEP